VIPARVTSRINDEKINFFFGLDLIEDVLDLIRVNALVAVNAWRPQAVFCGTHGPIGEVASLVCINEGATHATTDSSAEKGAGNRGFSGAAFLVHQGNRQHVPQPVSYKSMDLSLDIEQSRFCSLFSVLCSLFSVLCSLFSVLWDRASGTCHPVTLLSAIGQSDLYCI
jgi:hypothetical protein